MVINNIVSFCITKKSSVHDKNTCFIQTTGYEAYKINCDASLAMTLLEFNYNICKIKLFVVYREKLKISFTP